MREKKLVMNSATKEYNIFLSYARQDQPWVAEFVGALKTAGIENWFDVEAITPGERWDEKLEEALRQSETLIVFLSSHSVRSSYVYFEVGAAVADHKRIIPILIEEVDFGEIPSPLAQRQLLRATSPADAGKQVAEIIEKNSHSERF